MTPGRPDPRNHVPAVSSGDTWDDHDEPVTRLEPTIKLPRHREVRKTPGGSAGKLDPGLRIEVSAPRNPPKEEVHKLKIEEIGTPVVRLDTEEAPPRVERIVTFHERPALPPDARQNLGESGEWGKKHTISLRWILASAAAVVTLVVLCMIALPSINAPNAVPAGEQAMYRSDANEKSPGIDALNRLLTRQPEALSIYRSYLAAAHPDDLIPLIRDPQELKLALRRRWQPARLPGGWEPAADTGWLVMELEDHPCALLIGHLPDNSKFRAYFVGDNDRLLLDWKATTAYGTALFKDLEKGHGDGSEIRGEITLADFYTQSFPEADYQAYRLVSPDGEIHIWCYADRNTPAAATLANELNAGPILEKTTESKKVTLSLERGPEGAQPNQWLIRDLLQIDWVNR